MTSLRALSYIGACAAAVGCHPALAPLVPMELPPAARDSAVAWTLAMVPPQHLAIRFRWKYRDDRQTAGGRGQARIAPPDSLRFDWVATLGLASGAAVMVGDSVQWADPVESFRSLVPAIPMLWASLGTVRPPATDAVVSGRADPPRVLWRFARGADTLTYVATAAAPRVLEAEWRQQGKLVARSRTVYDAAAVGALPASARIDFPEGSARFEFTVVAVDTAVVIAPALWRSRR